MTPEQIERNRAFLADLRANEKKAVNQMRDNIGGRCCLCVAYDTAQRLGARLPHDDGSLPPLEMSRFYGWPETHKDPDVNEQVPEVIYAGEYHPAASLNDGCSGYPELTHAQIADAFEETFPELKA